MNDLREDLDRALRTVTFSEAPIERAKQAGRRIRTRRRVALLAGVLAVAAVAAGYPALSRNSAAPPAPATGTKTPAPHQAPYGGDPLLTDGPPGGTTQAPGGLATSSGVIASGAMGGVPWQVTVHGPGATNPVPADPCFTVSITSVGDLGASCSDFPTLKAGVLNSGTPVMFTGEGDAVTEATIGEAASVVTYVIVDFTDGQQLKLIPVTADGHRYIAWTAPLTMTVASVVAHLGRPVLRQRADRDRGPVRPVGAAARVRPVAATRPAGVGEGLGRHRRRRGGQSRLVRHWLRGAVGQLHSRQRAKVSTACRSAR